MAQNWKEVWEARQMDRTRGSVLAQLLAADGFDTGFGSLSESAWRQYVRQTAAAIGITPGASVFDVGCGSGAYLFELHQIGCRVAGLDASSALIRYANAVMPSGHWVCADAAELDISEPYDFVVASAVFLYFPSLGYSRCVLERMVAKARHGVLISDVPDLAKRALAMELRKREMGENAYVRRYAGLEHLYFDKAWFTTTLAALGVARARIEDQCVEGYANSAYRFNVFGWF
jgi:SAM-dependent methyltransferase